MSGIFDQIINYSPPLIVSGTVNYKGTWNASTNTPTLIDPPVASTKGDYYVVSTAGTQFSITFGVGDWIISNGTAWEKVDLTDAVSSVFGRTGAVVGDSTDYSAVGLTNTAIGASSPSTGAFTSLSSSSTTTLNGTTIPASKTLVVTTDKLSALAATTSAELASVISDETGSGALVFANSPTLVTPALGTPSSGTVTNLTGTASININGTVGATTPTTGVFTGLTVNDNTTLGSSNTDTVVFNARVASDLNPSADNTYDLGVTGHEWRNLNIDGTANIDSLVADTADINGGTIDGTAIGATTPSTGAFTTCRAGTSFYMGSANDGSTGQIAVVAGDTYFDYDGSLRFRALDAGTATILTLGTAGAAVTGTLSASGGISSSFAGAEVFKSTSSGFTNSTRTIAFTTAAGTDTVNFGVAGSTYSSLGISANDGYIYSPTPFSFSIGGSLVTRTSSTGLAVTGALSSTGTITSTSTGRNAFSGAIQVTGANPTNVAASTILDNSSGDARIICYGLNTSTRGTFTMLGISSDGSLNSTYFTANSTGLAVTGACDVSGFFRSNGETIGNSNSPLATAFADGNTGLSLRSSGDGSSVSFASFRKANATVIGSITRVTTTDAVIYNTTSDGRLKENLRDFTDSGRLIDSLKPRVFDWKNSDENGKNVVGFVAQEQHAADPIFAHIGAVTVGDEDPDTITKQWQRSDSALIPILVAELKSLRARVAALES
jgi:hypothetical protein